MNVTVPVGAKPVTLLVSVTLFPTTMVVEERVVETVGVALLTVRVSDPHVLDAGLLLESPLYVDCQL